jgi:hypothetical protein
MSAAGSLGPWRDGSADRGGGERGNGERGNGESGGGERGSRQVWVAALTVRIFSLPPAWSLS